MASEDWNTEASLALEQPMTVVPELPEIKLFGRWSCGDVQISDMSLEVLVYRCSILYLILKLFILQHFSLLMCFLGLHCC